MSKNRVIVRVDNLISIKRRLKGAKGARAGYLKQSGGGSKPYENDMTVAENAIYQNYGTRSSGGTRHIPARPFMDLAALMFEKSPKIVGRLLKAYMSGEMNAKAFNNALGALQAKDIKSSIRHGPWEANNPVTVERKGSSKPLIDDGFLINTVDSKGKGR